MVVDYSKWDKLECSSSDEEEQRRKRGRTTDPPPGPAGGGGGSSSSDDELEKCPPGLGPEVRKVWPTLSADRKRAILEHIEKRNVRYHPAKSLHKELFSPDNWERWIDPTLLAFISPWQKDKAAGFSKVDLESLDGLRLEAPGIVSFPAFNDEFCEMLLAEVRHYHTEGMPSRAPNSMNNYGLVLNEIGMRPVFSRLLSEVFLPLGAKLFGSDSDRLKTLHGEDIGTEDWGGSTLNDHHSFIVQYRPTDDKHLDMHIDECDVTFNFGITDTSNFEGNDLTFCGMFDSDNHRQYHHTYKHVKGRCVVHSGKRRHGALDITKGERASLIMWTKSTKFRQTPAYRMKNRAGLRYGPADRVCLSYTHDPDYKKLMPKKLQYRMASKQDDEKLSTASASTEAVATEKRWMRVCADSELEEGGAKMLSLERENEQVAVFRHRGKLFAMDNRCAHMGGPLCEGDIEDFGKHVSRSAGVLKGAGKVQDGVVKCPRHGMCFNIRTGENIKGGQMRQRLYPVRLANEGRDIEVEVEVEVSRDVDMSDSGGARDVDMPDAEGAPDQKAEEQPGSAGAGAAEGPSSSSAAAVADAGSSSAAAAADAEGSATPGAVATKPTSEKPLQGAKAVKSPAAGQKGCCVM